MPAWFRAQVDLQSAFFLLKFYKSDLGECSVLPSFVDMYYITLQKERRQSSGNSRCYLFILKCNFLFHLLGICAFPMSWVSLKLCESQRVDEVWNHVSYFTGTGQDALVVLVKRHVCQRPCPAGADKNRVVLHSGERSLWRQIYSSSLASLAGCGHHDIPVNEVSLCSAPAGLSFYCG